MKEKLLELARLNYKEDERVICKHHKTESYIFYMDWLVYVDGKDQLWSKSDFGNVCLYSKGEWAEKI